MKKFISFTAIAVILTLSSCREIDEISDNSIQTNSAISNKVTDSIGSNTPLDNYSTTQNETPKDPPVKDGQGW